MTDSDEAIRRFFAERTVKSESGTTLDASDGRVANRLRNRDRVIDTYVELVNEGKQGTLEEIVERSGVARRSVFRYFTDLSDLALAGFERVVTQASRAGSFQNPGLGSLESRIVDVVDVRMATYELTHAFGLMARRRLATIESVQAGLMVILEIQRGQLAEQFEPELSAHDGDASARVLDAAMLMVSFESYDLMTRQLARSPESVAATWRDALHSLLAA